MPRRMLDSRQAEPTAPAPMTPIFKRPVRSNPLERDRLLRRSEPEDRIRKSARKRGCNRGARDRQKIVIAMARATIATRAVNVLPLFLEAEPALLLQI